MSMFLIFQTSPGDLHPLNKIPVCAKLLFSPDLYLNKTHHEKEKMFNCITDMTYPKHISSGYSCTYLLLKGYEDP